MPHASTNLHLLITAGPTYEPIDAVRFIGNRSSGRLGSSLADEAAERGWMVTLLLGPNAVTPTNPRVRLVRFQSTADLQSRLTEFLPACDVLIMAAAVADYRPTAEEIDPLGKRRRTQEGMTLRLEATPDLLSGCSSQARPDQLLVGFALEPAAQLMESARAKLARKSIDLIVANPLETMDSPNIRAWLLGNPNRGIPLEVSTGDPMPKDRFAAWLLDHLTPLAQNRAASERARAPR